ncbi:MAG TPA: hypothetical protein VHK63_09090 [Candidatus Limnocylindria bacterium]|nr:hypothetical protein [Candidatus Limnocylindria bacterium]
MSIDPQFERYLRSWMDEGTETMSDRVRDTVLEAFPTTAQRRPVFGVARRSFRMQIYRYAMVAAAAAMAAIIGMNAVNSVGRPRPTPSVVPTPAPSIGLEGLALAPWGNEFHNLEAERYVTGRPFPIPVSFQAPRNWLLLGQSPHVVWTGVFRQDAGVAFWTPENVYVDPCDIEAGLLDPPLGRSAADFIEALRSLPGMRVTAPVQTSVDGHPAIGVTLTAPDTSECNAGNAKLWYSRSYSETAYPHITYRILAVDVNGQRLVIAGWTFPDTDPRAAARVEAVMSSVELD